MVPWRATAGLGAKEPDDMLRRGYDLAYNLDHVEAFKVLAQAIKERPDDPAAYRAIAAITWLRVLFLRRAVLVDNYLVGSSRRPTGKVKDPPKELDEIFRTHIERAIELSEDAVRRAPDDPDSHHELGASVALAASYKASIEDNPLRALREAKRAYTAHQKVLELDPSRKDANLILGLYRYIVSLMPRAFRMVAYLVGFEGGKEEAIGLIEEAAEYPGETQTEAKVALVLLYNLENHFEEAQHVLNDLKIRYPRNRLWWLESASTWLRDERAWMAERPLLEGFSKLATDDRTRMAGEEAVWKLKRGGARVALGLTDEARPDLIAARDAEIDAWVTGHAHLELGKIADLNGDRLQARQEYDRARKLCRRAKDKKCEKSAETLKDDGFSLE